MQPRSTIITLPENTAGRDFIIGDIHGNIAILTEAVAQLNENDRLFLVGDLIDKGRHSKEVLNLILEHNKKRLEDGKKPQLYAVRGNHEEMFLLYAKSRRKHPHELNPEIENMMIGSGGRWAFKLSNEELTTYENYFSSLPEVIYVAGSNPFNIVHADMPVNDRQLTTMINDNIPLNSKQRFSAHWARASGDPVFFPVTGRNAASITTYCGHQIHGGIRYQTNHLNLDSGAYHTRQALFVNHTDSECYILKKTSKTNHEVEDNCVKIQIELTFRAQRRNFCTAIAMKTPSQINAHILELTTRRHAPTALAEQKDLYLSELRNISSLLNQDQKNGLLQFLVSQPNHLLKQERHWWCRFHHHSMQTRSMHTAADVLCGLNDYQKDHGRLFTRHISEFTSQ